MLESSDASILPLQFTCQVVRRRYSKAEALSLNKC